MIKNVSDKEFNIKNPFSLSDCGNVNRIWFKIFCFVSRKSLHQSGIKAASNFLLTVIGTSMKCKCHVKL